MLAAIGAWFVLGAWAWWVVTAFAVIMLFVAIDKDWHYFGVGELFVYALFLQLVAGVNIIGLIIAHPLLAVAYFAGYLIIGTIWSIVKWWVYLRKKAESLREQKANGYKISSYQIPKAKDKKGKIANWILFWPISFIWTFLDDVVKEIANKIVETLNSLYQGIANSVFKDIKIDE